MIVCEGRETERHYFDELKREDDVTSRFAVTVQKGKGGSRRQIVQDAIDRKNRPPDDFDEVWCVMDTEQLATAESREDLAAARKIAVENDIHLCLSNPGFEVWFLAHFVRTSRIFVNCDAVIAELNKHFKKLFGADYAKNDRQMYGRLRDRTHAAIDHSKNVLEYDHGDKSDIADCNSASEVFRLVDHLLN